MTSTSYSRAWQEATARGLGRALPPSLGAPPAPDGFALWTLAVSEEGRRLPSTPVASAEALAWTRGSPPGEVLVLLDHAGPAASCWREARAVGASEAPSPATGRSPRALDEAGWRQVVEAFARAAALCRQAGCPAVVVHAADDGLLAASLSPLQHPGASLQQRMAPLLDVVRAVRAEGLEVGLLLTVEELAPGGQPPAAGVEVAAAAVREGVGCLFATAGTGAFPELWRRPRPMGDDEVWLASATWLRGRTAAPVFAAGPVHRPERALELARAAGLAGVVDTTPEEAP